MIQKGDNKIGIPWYRRNVKLSEVDDMGINPISFHLPNIPKPKPNLGTRPQTEPATQPATQPATNPIKVPFTQPVMQPNPLPFPNPNPFPPIVLPERKPNTAPAPVPQPAFIEKAFSRILTPLFILFAARGKVNDYVKVNVTDPIYGKMLKDPVLGTVLRESEKANMDAGKVGTILANFDWENGDYKDLEKSLAVGVGAAGAARLLIFIVGRKVVFKI